MPQHVEARDVVHVEVYHRDVEDLALELGQGVLAAGGLRGEVPLAAQHDAEALAHPSLVVDHEQLDRSRHVKLRRW